MLTADCRLATPPWIMIMMEVAIFQNKCCVKYLASNEPCSEKLLELWRVELEWIKLTKCKLYTGLSKHGRG